MRKLILLLAVMSFCVPVFAGTCVGVALGSLQKNKGRFDATFSATQIIDLDVSVLFTNSSSSRLRGDHKAEIRLFTPRGHLYQSFLIPFTSDTSKRGKSVFVPGYPQPLPMQVVQPVANGNLKYLRAFTTLPVAGTPILMNSMYGTWTADAVLDDAKSPCSTRSKFTLTK
jgi:hypothetical protein